MQPKSKRASVSTKAFAAALSRVSALATGRTTLPILNTVKISGVDNRIEIHATNCDAHGVARCECDGEFGAVCVNARTLANVLKSAGEQVVIEVVGNRLKLQSASDFGLSYLDVKEFPPFPKPDGIKQIGVPPVDLADCLEAVAWAAAYGKDAEARQSLAAVNVLMRPKQLRCAATTGRALAIADRDVICSDAEFNVPAPQTGLLVDSLRDSGAVVSLSESWICCHADNLTVAVRLSEIAYPHYLPIVQEKRTAIGEFEVAPIVDAVSSVAGLSTDRDFPRFAMDFGSEGATLTMEDTDNNFKTTFGPPCESESLRLNALLTSMLLRSLKTEKVKLSKTDLHVLVFESPNYTAILQCLVTPVVTK